VVRGAAGPTPTERSNRTSGHYFARDCCDLRDTASIGACQEVHPSRCCPSFGAGRCCPSFRRSAMRRLGETVARYSAPSAISLTRRLGHYKNRQSVSCHAPSVWFLGSSDQWARAENCGCTGVAVWLTRPHCAADVARAPSVVRVGGPHRDCSEANLEALESRNIDAYVATGRARDAVAGTAMPSPEPPIHSFWIRFSPPSASTDCDCPAVPFIPRDLLCYIDHCDNLKPVADWRPTYSARERGAARNLRRLSRACRDQVPGSPGSPDLTLKRPSPAAGGSAY
jgi:hypothetical protein